MLCEVLGFAHPDYLLDQLDARQLNDWLAYLNRHGPIGSRRQDLLLGQLTCLTYNVNRGRGHAEPISSFMPYSPEDLAPDEITPQQQLQQLRSLLRRK